MTAHEPFAPWFSLSLDLHDLWIGVYWRRRAGRLVVYVCPLPCLVARFGRP